MATNIIIFIVIVCVICYFALLATIKNILTTKYTSKMFTRYLEMVTRLEVDVSADDLKSMLKSNSK